MVLEDDGSDVSHEKFGGMTVDAASGEVSFLPIPPMLVPTGAEAAQAAAVATSANMGGACGEEHGHFHHCT